MVAVERDIKLKPQSLSNQFYQENIGDEEYPIQVRRLLQRLAEEEKRASPSRKELLGRNMLIISSGSRDLEPFDLLRQTQYASMKKTEYARVIDRVIPEIKAACFLEIAILQDEDRQREESLRNR